MQKIWKFTPNEAWVWITNNKLVGEMTDAEVKAASDRAGELWGEINWRLDKEVTANEITGGLDFETAGDYMRAFWPSAVKQARDEVAGRLPWQSPRNEWAERMLGSKPEIPTVPDFDSKIQMLLASGDIEKDETGYRSVTKAGKEAIGDLWTLKHNYDLSCFGYAAQMRDRMTYKLDLFKRHQESVAEALADGKPVSAEVLKDYPEFSEIFG